MLSRDEYENQRLDEVRDRHIKVELLHKSRVETDGGVRLICTEPATYRAAGHGDEAGRGRESEVATT